MIVKLVVNEKNTLKGYLESFYLGKNKINYLIDSSCIKVNNVLSKDRTLILNIGDKLSIDTSIFDTDNVIPTYYDLEVLYEDDYLIAFNKPRGVIVYDADHNVNTLDNYVKYYYEVNNINCAVRHLHRLDAETTGVIIYAKDILTHAFLSHQFEEKTIKKTYLTMVEGMLLKGGKIEAPIGKHRHENNKMIITKYGDYAKTLYDVVENYPDKTLLKVNIITGRTHQIRVHMAYLGHPVIGDSIYNRNFKKGEKLMLHCESVEFIHPESKCIIKVEKNISF